MTAVHQSDGRRLPLPTARVTVITAPAGSGKDRLLQDWLADGDWARIDLDPPDRTPTAPGGAAELGFGEELAEAIEWLSADDRRRPRFVLTGLEMLSAEQAGELVAKLLAGLPPRVPVILAGGGSGLPAGTQVRLADDLAELRAADLWWARSDLADQLHRLTGIGVTEPEADRLFRLTAGWPAGVLILGRALRSRPAGSDGGVEPEILDFVTAEVLDRLTAPVRRFVVRTSVLDALELDDCAALVPDEIPQVMLTQVHRQGLTVAVWPDPEGVESGVRYHPLVRAAARRELHGLGVDAATGLLRIAGERARRRDREPEAVAHLAAAGDWDAVMGILFSAAANGFRGWEPARLRAAVQQLPEPLWAGAAEGRALVAFAAAMSGDHLLAAHVIQQTSAPLRAGAAWWSAVAWLIEALSGPVGGVRGGYRAACAALVELQALDRAAAMPAFLGVVDRPSLIGMAHLLAARAGVFDRDPAGVRRHLEAGWTEAGVQIPRYCVLAGLGADALTAAWGGQLAAAQRRATRAQRLAGEAGLVEHPLLSLTLLAGVEVLRARGQSRAALAELDARTPALARSEPFVAAASGGQVHTAWARILRAMLRLDLAEAEPARSELIRFRAEGDDDLPRNLAAALAVAWARLHLLTDDVAAAEPVLAAAPATGLVTATRIAAALQRRSPEDAQAILQAWPFEDTLDNRIRRLLAGAAVAIALDRRQEAAAQIDQALVAAEPDGQVQVFLDAPPRARALAAAVLKRSPDSSGWRAELAERLDRIRMLTTDAGAVPITQREQAVLEYLTTSMTHAQIAGELFVSENTLKSHCRNLYRKLGVNTRADAVRVARARGWLEPAARGSVLDLDSSPGGDVVLDLNITPVSVVVEL